MCLLKPTHRWHVRTRFAFSFLLCLQASAWAADVKDPDKVLRRLQYSYTVDEVKQLRAQPATVFMNQRIQQAEQDLQNRAKQPKPSIQALMEQDAEMLEGVRGLPRNEAEEVVRKNRLWQNSLQTQTTEDSLDFYQSNPSGLAPRWLWFWSNHFNVLSDKSFVRIFLAPYESQAIGAHAFGTFPALLQAAVLHPAMLVYLDNQNNQKDKLNENLAREVLELHTLGEGKGYTQQDVQVLAKALTGYSFIRFDARNKNAPCRLAGCVLLGNTGAVFEPALHDTSDKQFMGKLYLGRTDGRELLDMLHDIAMHPNTAQRLATRLATYFIGDSFPDSVVQQMKQVYLKTGGDLKQVLQTLLTHPAFLQAQQRWVADPLSHWVGQLRQTRLYGQTQPAKRLVWLLRQTGAPHFGRVTPDGYPLTSTAWDSASTLAIRLEASGALASELFKGMMNGGGGGPVQQQMFKNFRANLGANSQTALAPYESNFPRWLSVYFLSPEVVYF